MEHRQVDEGRFILARFEPEYEYDLDVDGHNELLPLSQDREHPKEFVAGAAKRRRNMAQKSRTGIQRGWLWIPVRLLRSTRGVRHRGAGERLAARVTCPWVSSFAILDISFSLADFGSSRPRELPAVQYSERK